MVLWKPRIFSGISFYLLPRVLKWIKRNIFSLIISMYHRLTINRGNTHSFLLHLLRSSILVQSLQQLQKVSLNSLNSRYIYTSRHTSYPWKPHTVTGLSPVLDCYIWVPTLDWGSASIILFVCLAKVAHCDSHFLPPAHDAPPTPPNSVK